MTTPRAHADLATLYFSDAEMMCWGWEEGEDGYHWWYLPNPSFIPGRIYHVGKIAPTEPPQIMCELAGVKFPMPAQEQLNYGKKYFVPAVGDPDYPTESFWTDTEIDKERLEHNLIQSTKKGATQQGWAIVAVLKQAFEKSRSN